MLGAKLTVVLLDNGGFGCIHRLQQAVGSAPFNNLLKDTGRGTGAAPAVDFAAHAASLGALAESVTSPDQLQEALARARSAGRTAVVCVRTDPDRSTAEGGAWWDVAVPEVSARAEVRAARARYEAGKKGQRP
jgi:3D-(3,5/4)-trihydroxycyclohexane-1,2-dione acylhydrolase (decyclizing)